MKSVQQLVREADPLQYESTCPPSDRDRCRQAILEASLTAALPRQSRSRSRLTIFAGVASILIAAPFFASHTHSPSVGDLQAAVRFEVRLAEDKPAAGLREVKRSGSAPPVYIHQEAVVTNSDIASARVLPGASPAQYEVAVEFNASGAQKMRHATASHLGKPMAIIIDGQVVAAPLLRTPIGASAVIDGDFTKAEAERIASGVGLR